MLTARASDVSASRSLPLALSPERRAHAHHERVQASPQPVQRSRTGSASSPGDHRTDAEAAATDVLRAVGRRGAGGGDATTATMMGPDTRNVAFTESEQEREVRVCMRGR